MVSIKAVANKPIKTFRAGTVTASVWEKKTEVNKKEVTFYNVSIVKNYKDDKDEWKQTNNFAREDLVKVALVTNKAIEFIYLTDSE